MKSKEPNSIVSMELVLKGGTRRNEFLRFIKPDCPITVRAQKDHEIEIRGRFFCKEDSITMGVGCGRSGIFKVVLESMGPVTQCPYLRKSGDIGNSAMLKVKGFKPVREAVRSLNMDYHLVETFSLVDWEWREVL